jgi:predicted nucleic acid-binding protein
MEGYLLDTNSIIYALNDKFLFPNDRYFVSIITEIELLSYQKLTSNEEYILKEALSNFKSLNLTPEIKNKTIEIRKKYHLKLPDSIIVASAVVQNVTLVTSDKKLLNLDFLKGVELYDIK